MKKPKKSNQWWAYLIGCFILSFLIPYLMSARDTILVIVGLILMVVLAVVSWKFWIRPLIQFVWRKMNEV